MKPAAPVILRKGALVRVAGDGTTEPVEVLALSYVDLRFGDGHVERWLGPGEGDTLARAALRDWGEQVIDNQGERLIEELEMEFRDVHPRVLDDVPVEVVVEWNAQLPRS
jgi:hypothetical protein